MGPLVFQCLLQIVNDFCKFFIFHTLWPIKNQWLLPVLLSVKVIHGFGILNLYGVREDITGGKDISFRPHCFRQVLYFLHSSSTSNTLYISLTYLPILSQTWFPYEDSIGHLCFFSIYSIMAAAAFFASSTACTTVFGPCTTSPAANTPSRVVIC